VEAALGEKAGAAKLWPGGDNERVRRERGARPDSPDGGVLDGDSVCRSRAAARAANSADVAADRHGEREERGTD
jgi:hypothetical protein